MRPLAILPTVVSSVCLPHANYILNVFLEIGYTFWVSIIKRLELSNFEVVSQFHSLNTNHPHLD